MMTLYRRLRLRYGMRWDLPKRRTVTTLEIIAKDVLVIIVALMALLGLYGFMTERDLHEASVYRLSGSGDYVKHLEHVVANCLSDSTGRPITIGDQTYLCGIVPTGVKL
jgi:hypothetical protein